MAEKRIYCQHEKIEFIHSSANRIDGFAGRSTNQNETAL